MTTLQSLRDLLAAASAGPWVADHKTVWNDSQRVPDGASVGSIADCEQFFDDETTAANARLIAAMRNALPAILDELAASRRVVGAAREHVAGVSLSIHGLSESIDAYDRATGAKGDEK